MYIAHKQRLSKTDAYLGLLPPLDQISSQPLNSISPSKAQKFKLFALSRRNNRQGAAAVEFAVIAPLLFFLLLGLIEFGRVMMVQQMLTNSAREGARKAVLANAKWSEVYAVVDGYMDASGINGYTCNEPAGFSSASQGDPITIEISVPYRNCSWMSQMTGTIFGMDFSFGGIHDKTLKAKVVMRKEANNN